MVLPPTTAELQIDRRYLRSLAPDLSTAQHTSRTATVASGLWTERSCWKDSKPDMPTVALNSVSAPNEGVEECEGMRRGVARTHGASVPIDTRWSKRRPAPAYLNPTSGGIPWLTLVIGGRHQATARATQTSRARLPHRVVAILLTVSWFHVKQGGDHGVSLCRL